MDARSEIRTFLSILIVGLGLIIWFQLWLNEYMNWYHQPWDVLILSPVYIIWTLFGAPYIADKITKRKNKNDVR